MEFSMVYAFCFIGDLPEQSVTYYKRVDLPFPPPVGTTVWIPDGVEDDSLGFPTIISDHEHWIENNRYDVCIEFDEDAVGQNVKSAAGGFAELCKILEFHGWKTSPGEL